MTLLIIGVALASTFALVITLGFCLTSVWSRVDRLEAVLRARGIEV